MVGDVVTISGPTFVSTNAGAIEVDLSLDGTDIRVTATGSADFIDSHNIAGAFVNANTTANGAIVNNTFTDMVFGTAGSALIAISTMERWRLTNELNGTFEYFGNEPFDGRVTFDFTIISDAGTEDFRFKFVSDTGSGFADLEDNVEALIDVGPNSKSVSKTYPLMAVAGDLVKPQITRNAGTSVVTTSYATIYCAQ